MKIHYILIFLIVCFLNVLAKAESYGFEPDSLSGAGIHGVVLDSDSNSPIEYATIVVYSQAEAQVLTGTISAPNGKFEIKNLDFGNYYVIISFIAYKEYRIDDIQLNTKNSEVDLGTVFLEKDAELLKEVEIVAQHHNIDYQIDKKVIAVNQQLTSASMSAVEILENIPSVRVDIEGNVTLRGSGGITVLIDGRPTILEASDVLSQIPASTIQNIEIITNPSAKYEPDGTGGIINIITKKNKSLGLQGILNVSANSFGMYRGDILLNYNTGKTNFYISAQHGAGPRKGAYFSERRTIKEDTTTVVISNGTYERIRNRSEIKMGFNWDVNLRNNISVEYSPGKSSHINNSEQDYMTSREIDDFQLNEINLNESSRGGFYHSLTGNYVHKFLKDKHQLNVQANYSFRDGKEYSENFLLDQAMKINDGTRTTEDGPSSRVDLKLDYSLPLNGKDMFEAGTQLRSGRSIDVTNFYRYDLDDAGFIKQEAFGNDIQYDRHIFAGYGLYRGQLSQFGYQIGLRTEYTYRKTFANAENKKFLLDRWDYFPTLHFSYELPKENQFMVSYSRRIDRPRSYFLEPFVTWSDMFNVRRGNPDLLPEYIDGFELGYIKQWQKTRLSIESYYRIQYNKIERFYSVYDEGILLTTFENVGTDYSLGIETMFNTNFLPWWDLTLMGNVFDYRIKGERAGVSFAYSSFNWSSRLDNTFRVSKNLRFQLNGQYNGPSVTSQGKNLAYYELSTALRMDFLDGKFSTVLQVRDIFSTHKHVSIASNDDFYYYRTRSTNGPIISLSLSYKINNYKQESDRKGGRGGEMNGNGGEDE
jgi:outer membrane receptor protein involved in Fe transport